MANEPSKPKPVSEIWRPELVTLPRLTFARRVFRVLIIQFIRAVAFFTMRVKMRGMENFPARGPALIVLNHIGDADVLLLAAYLPVAIEGMGKIELFDDWRVGPILSAYGIIWIHRGRSDRRALRAGLDALAEGRILGIAPEGRQTTTDGLEEGTEGAAFIALKSGAPVIPIAMTGTENEKIYGRKWLERIPVTLTVGKSFYVKEQADRHESIRAGTRQIMEEIARLLPKEYQGIYSYVSNDG